MRTTCKFFDSNLQWRSPPATATTATAATVADKPRIGNDISNSLANFWPSLSTVCWNTRRKRNVQNDIRLCEKWEEQGEEEEERERGERQQHGKWQMVNGDATVALLKIPKQIAGNSNSNHSNIGRVLPLCCLCCCACRQQHSATSQTSIDPLVL